MAQSGNYLDSKKNERHKESHYNYLIYKTHICSLLVPSQPFLTLSIVVFQCSEQQKQYEQRSSLIVNILDH